MVSLLTLQALIVIKWCLRAVKNPGALHFLNRVALRPTSNNMVLESRKESRGNITISLLMNITMNQLGGASVIAKFHS